MKAYFFVRLALALVASPVPAAAHNLPCTLDDALSQAAAELVLSGERLRSQRLLPRARAFGFDGVAIQAHEGSDDATLLAWFTSQRERAEGELTCGEARSATRRVVLLSVRAGRLRFAQGRIYAQLAPAFHSPQLIVEDALGSTHRFESTTQALASGVELPSELTAKRLQLVAEGPSGPRPVAELELMREPTFEPPAVGNQEQHTAPRALSRLALLTRVGAYRNAQGAPSLRANQLLETSAQRHAQRVCELGKVAHNIAGDDPETRLRAERVTARAAGEAVARARSAEAAFAAIFASLSHRMVVSDRSFTDVGIGQALDAKGHTCLVVLLAAWPRRLP